MTEREQIIGEWHQHLAGAQEQAADENPFGNFQSKLRAEDLANFSPDEQNKLRINEEAAFNRRQQLSQAKNRQRKMWIASGGDVSGFEDHWSRGGESEHLAAASRDRYQRWVNQSGFDRL